MRGIIRLVVHVELAIMKLTGRIIVIGRALVAEPVAPLVAVLLAAATPIAAATPLAAATPVVAATPVAAATHVAKRW